jgi:hypothetical protein
MNINDYKKVTDRLTPDERLRKEVLDMSKRENKIKLNTNEYIEDVTGVEVRSGRGIMKYVSIAAACALIVGGIVTTGVLLHKNNKNAQQLAEISEEETTAEAVTEIAEETTEAPVEYDFDAIARELTDSYLDELNVLVYGDVEYDTNSAISFNIVDSSSEEWTNDYGYEKTFYKVTDQRFHSCQDVYEYYKKSLASRIFDDTTDQYYDIPESFDGADSIYGGGMINWLGGDVSKFAVGSNVDLRPSGNRDEADEEAFALHIANFIDYNGELYSRGERGKREYSTEPMVISTEEDKCVVTRYFMPDYVYADNYKYGAEMVFTLVSENGEWKIESTEEGTQPEYLTFAAVQCYVEKDHEYDDIDLGEGDEKYATRRPVLTSLEISDYDFENKTARIHAILHDMAGVDAAEIEADIDYNTVTLSNVNLKRLKDYDETLKRPSVIWKETHPDE